MTSGTEYSNEEIIRLVEEKGYPAHFVEYFRKAIPFHTYAAPGLLIGIFMMDYALELLGAKPGEKLYATCETYKCAPDPLQIILSCTIGNHRLSIVPVGRFAITLNKPVMGDVAEGYRVRLDPVKIKLYPILQLWFANSPQFDKKIMSKTLVDQILTAGRDVLSFRKVRIPVTQKEKWKSSTCPVCGEDVPEKMMEGDRCAACGSLKYYEEI